MTLPLPPSDADALHAAHVLRDYGRHLGKTLVDSPLRSAALGASFAAIKLVFYMPPGGAECPLCGFVFRVAGVPE